MRTLRLTLSAVIFLLAPAAARAAVTRVAVSPVDNGGVADSQLNLAGTKTSDLKIDFSGQMGGQRVQMDLTQGSLVNHPLGPLPKP